MTPNPVNRTTAAFALACFAGCAGAESPDQRASYDADSLPAVVAEEDGRIGNVDDPSIGFSRIGGVAQTADGLLVVLEQQAREIRVYDPDGSLLRRFGGPGSGPGEFRSPGAMGSSGDTIWVYDFLNARLTLFRTDGTLLETVPGGGFRVDVPGANVRVVPDRPIGRGRFASRLVSASEGTTPTDSARAPAVAFDENGEVVDTLGSHFVPNSAVFQVAVQMYGVIVPQPLDEWPMVIGAGSDTVIVSRTAAVSEGVSQFSITRTRSGGDTVYHHAVSYTPVPVDPDSVVAAMMRVNAGLPVSMTAVEAKIREYVPQQSFHPPIRRFVTGADGTLWLQREDPGGATTKWLVIDSLGVPLAHVLFPREARVMWVSQDVAWVVIPDELDVPWLVRMRMGIAHS